MIELDHLVSVESSLRQAGVRWNAAGFDVRAGGRHDGLPTRNALAPLGRGQYVELLSGARAWVRPWLRLRRRLPGPDPFGGDDPLKTRFLRLVGAGRGLADACFAASGDLDGLVQRARSAGVRMAGPVAMGRTRPDGVRLAWRLALPLDPFLPFFIEDRTDPAHRRPSWRCAWSGVRRLRLAVPSRASARVAFEALFDSTGHEGRAGAVTFDVGGLEVVVEGGPRYLRHRLEITLSAPCRDGRGRTHDRRLPRGVLVAPGPAIEA